MRERLVRAAIDVEVCRGFAYNTAFLASEGTMFGIEGSMTKLFASEAYKKHSRWFLDVAGPEGMLDLSSPGGADGRATRRTFPPCPGHHDLRRNQRDHAQSDRRRNVGPAAHAVAGLLVSGCLVAGGRGRALRFCPALGDLVSL